MVLLFGMIGTGILITGVICIVSIFGLFTLYIEHILIFIGFVTGLGFKEMD